ncbi:uncharacterized protein N7500_002343 [Penicillium coprophilum]|uniref:uncharacterized protein n=1 Tax=Penicillium coprophilum TaxID=36646 RepID=UPI002391851A|nr:uncharacterized protein N7500_002343 [Penicillium coprophilum]KAJ5169560.1 hypothetical protein N7500_002343 [Penicillium coprophilum]
MPKKKVPAQSDTSVSAQSEQSIGSQFANQSPATSTNSRSSGGLTRMMSTIYEKFSSGSNSNQLDSFDGAASPDLRTAPEVRKTDLRTAPEVKTKHPARKDPLPKKRRVYPLGSKHGGVSKPSPTPVMSNVIAATEEAIIGILDRTELEGTRYSYVANKWTAPALYPESVDFPNFIETKVQVFPADTYDAALDMDCSGSNTDQMPVCVLNFANANVPGGGWRHGAKAQEEQLCYRSTLIGALQPDLYPMGDLECLYSPNVIIFRESVDRGYKFMSSADDLHRNPNVSVISMAARSRPKLTADKSTYNDPGQSYLMKDKMRLILRTAAGNNHRRLVLGALGCGAFSHPSQVVADCWKEVLMEVEFRGWFEQVYFAIRDGPTEKNVEKFEKTLHGLNIG